MKLCFRNSVPAGCLTFCLAWASCVLPAHAQAVISETVPLYFGRIAIVSYGAVGRVTLDPSGSYSNNSNVYLLDPPHLGEYHIENGPTNSAYTVTLPVSFSIMGPGGPFTVDNLEVRPLTLITDGSGDDDFTISGRLQTLGGGTPYGDGNYTTNFAVTVNF